MTNGIGMAYIKKEGAHMHPDEMQADMPDDRYKQQLEGYCRDVGLDVADVYPGSARPRLWQENCNA